MRREKLCPHVAPVYRADELLRLERTWFELLTTRMPRSGSRKPCP